MKQMKRLLCAVTLVTSLMLNAQTEENSKGIKWTTGLSWEQIKQKAKQENKYIFLDCFTTWCGPCKMMDKNVYVNDTVGNYFNEKFIAVKVQMDKTAKDNDQVKQWYDDIPIIAKQYMIEGYPSLVFLSPQGQIVHKEMGFKTPKEFIEIASLATQPGRIYKDNYAEYTRLVTLYKTGERNYDQYPFMIQMANKLNEDKFCHELLKDLSDYVLQLPVNKRYTKDRIDMWAGFSFMSASRVFGFFYKDGDIIDKVMNYKGYSAAIVDKTIQVEMVMPFIQEQLKDSIAKSGLTKIDTVTGQVISDKSNYAEADWKKLDNMIRKKYGISYAKRNVLTARVEWYGKHRNYLARSKYGLIKLKKYPPDISKENEVALINEIAWQTFINSTDQKILRGYSKCMSQIVVHYPNWSECLDTYAQLLYKSGEKDKAIEWEQKAVALDPHNKNTLQALGDMNLGKPTYLNYGAKWASQ